MTQAQHTPGPWAFKKTKINSHDGRYIVGPKEQLEKENLLNPETLPKMLFYTTEGGYDYCHPHSRALANARLIAAAPELLEALQLVANCVTDEQNGLTLGEYEQGVIKAAIAKARGQE